MHDRTAERRRLPRLPLDKSDGLVGMVARPDSSSTVTPASILDISRIGFRLVFEDGESGGLTQAPVLLLDKIMGTATIRFSEPVQLDIKWLQADPRHNQLILGCEIGRIADSDLAQVAGFVDAEMRWKRTICRGNGACGPADPGRMPLTADTEEMEELTPMIPENDPPRANRYRLAACMLAGILVAAAALLWIRTPGTTSDARYPGLDNRLRALEDSRTAQVFLDERIQQLEIETQALRRALSDSVQARDTLAQRLEEISVQLAPATPPRSTAGAAATAPAAPTDDAAFHTVGRGENLFRIALRHQTTVEQLRAANNLQADDPIRPGQKLKLPES
jgi:hypothetical protein